MKTRNHPNYASTQVTCLCGASFATASTAGPSLTVDVCSACHPFFTGHQRILDNGGRVARFVRRYPAHA